MKKITLLSIVFTMILCLQVNSQVSEDFETDPPAGWTFMQTEADDPGFVQTDLRANSGTYSFYHNDDNIAVSSTSWMISPSLTVSTGDILSFFHNHNYDTYGEENGIWISTASADPIANPGDFTLLYDLLANLSEDTWTEYTQSLDAYNGMTVYFAFKYSGDFEDELYIDDFFAGTPPTETADWNNLQWPDVGAITTGDNYDVYSRVFESGITEAAGQGAGIEAWIGYDTADTDPSAGGWTWIASTYNVDDFNNDEYVAEIGSGLAAGTYYYASRFRVEGGPFTYGGFDSGGGNGFWDGTIDVSGVLTVTDPPAPDCATTPIFPADGATDQPVGVLINFSWTAPASGPTPTSYNVYAGGMADGSDQGLVTNETVTNVDLFLNLYSTTVYWSIRPVNGTSEATGCPLWSVVTEAPPPPPANNDCAGALALTPGVIFTDNPITGSNISTTDSGETLPGCASYSGGDLWYSVVVPPDGNITLETDSNPTGNVGDSGAAAYSGSCGSLVLISCNDDGGNGLYSQVVISDIGLAGQTIYFRVWEFGNSSTIDFQVSAYSATLGLGDNKIEGFTMYPNPVKDLLHLSAQENINTVSIYSLLGQEVMRLQPNTIKSQVDISSLSTGMYVVKVQVGDKTGSYRIIKQ